MIQRRDLGAARRALIYLQVAIIDSNLIQTFASIYMSNIAELSRLSDDRIAASRKIAQQVINRYAATQAPICLASNPEKMDRVQGPHLFVRAYCWGTEHHYSSQPII